VGFTAIYGVLMVADLYLLRKFAVKGIAGATEEPDPRSGDLSPARA
jgi:hypothetical protein